jgi:hypothetical protein
MKKWRKYLNLFLAAVGAILFYMGRFVLVGENIKSLSGLCIGFGAAMFCVGISNFVGAIVIKEETARKKNIEVHDERNIRIRERVGAKINQVMLYVISAILLTLGLMQESMIIIVMLTSVLVLELVLAIVLTNYYSKIM